MFLSVLYLVAAVIGGTVLVCQFAMALFGLGHDSGDFSHDGGSGFAGDAHVGGDFHGDHFGDARDAGQHTASGKQINRARPLANQNRTKTEKPGTGHGFPHHSSNNAPDTGSLGLRGRPDLPGDALRPTTVSTSLAKRSFSSTTLPLVTRRI